MKTLPLGIDLGATAVRIVLCAYEQGQAGLIRVVRFTQPSRDPVTLGKTIKRELAAAGIREQRCIMTMQDPDACMRTLELPPMSQREIEAVAQLEAERLFGEGQGLARVAAVRRDHDTVIGLARRKTVNEAQLVARHAGLKIVALDHASYAYGRVFPHADAVADIGHNRTRFFALRGGAPWSTTIDIAGEAVTAAIARAYGIDEETAQKRKIERASASGAERTVDALVEGIGRAIRTARINGSGDIETLILVGNGARTATLMSRLERDTGCLVEVGRRQPFASGNYGEDVVVVALADWALAIGAAAWSLPEDEAA